MKFNVDKTMSVLRRTLILFFCLWGLVWLSIRAHKKPKDDRNLVERGLVFAASVPGIVEHWLIVTSTGLEHQERPINSEYEPGRLGELTHIPHLNDHLYLLYYRYEGGHTGSVYLQNIKTGEVAHTWHIPLQKIFEDLQVLKQELQADFAEEKIPVNVSRRVANTVPAIHINSPIMGEDFSLMFNCNSLGHLYKIDKDSQLLWKSEEIVHHSIELDENGNIWTCSVNLQHPLSKLYDFREDAILCLNAAGKRSHFYSLSDILKENALFKTLLAATPSMQQNYGQDPYHLNDVLPVKSDGKFWKRGDLFLSIRNKSAIIQYRPKDGSVVWFQQGPWLAQHDINIVNESTISVFNNNRIFVDSSNLCGESSNIAFFNLSDKTTEYFGDGLFASETEGRQTTTVDDWILVEVTNKGEYLFLDSSGAVQCRFYIPYYNDPSHAMNPTWARLYLKNETQFVLQE